MAPFDELTVVTDLQDTGWLKYILEEFKRINYFNGEIKILNLYEIRSLSQPNTLYYTADYCAAPSLVNKSSSRPTKTLKRLDEEIFVFDPTITEDKRFILLYDLFWNAFCFLSRLEEYTSAKTGKKNLSYSSRHPRMDKSTFETPIVNCLFDRLEKILKDCFPRLSFGEKQKPAIELTHDVDYIQKTTQLRLKQTAFNGYNAARNFFDFRRLPSRIRKTIRFLFSNPPYLCLDYWQDLEAKWNRHSVFYIYAFSKRKNLKSWLLDPSYDIQTNTDFKEKLIRLKDRGWEIGLHGSYFSANDEALMREEKNILEKSLRCKITKVRQHWLNYDEDLTASAHEKLFEADSSLGFNDRCGFRNGCLSPFRPYDHKNQKPFRFLETPFVLMDSHIFDYGARDIQGAQASVLKILRQLSRFKSAKISICWHQRVCNDDYGRHPFYEEILESFLNSDEYL